MKKLTNITDADLVKAYQSGDIKALSALVKRWHVSFCKLAYWYVKDADIAKDIAQESWTIIIRKLNDLKEPKKFKSWAISIVNRRAIDWIRAQRNEDKKLHRFYHERSSKVISETNEDYKQELRSKLIQSIYELSDDQQMVVKLFYTQNYSLKEISSLLKISVGTTKSRLFHAREKLKTILKT
ncbi:sigma-70 family RNA polymerase sigma factor [Flavobacteriaceae bacterium S356]|uniref:Sigma-70 family RNA polymerase sigma factor n=1 Tax=Asprobacillus argus TaxID=3076534 RepID=A0ABU3LE57_9FLAO|nr:sigma-70 family RNA polymerase sigma factor [Flavobacteriaceae bacterium S356]